MLIYGKDLNNDTSFATLLEVSQRLGIDRICFTTSHPCGILNADMIDIIAKYDNINVFSIHLPVQSGNDEVLKLRVDVIQRQ